MIEGSDVLKHIEVDEGCRFAPLLEIAKSNDLVKILFMTEDWCFSNGVPNEWVMDRVKGINGVFYKQNNINDVVDSDSVVIDSKGVLKVQGYSVVRLFVRGSSIEVNCVDNARCFIYTKDSDIKTTGNGNVKIFNR